MVQSTIKSGRNHSGYKDSRDPVQVPPEIVRQRGALLMAVSKIMLIYGVTAPEALNGKFDAQLKGFMMEPDSDLFAPGLTEAEAKAMLEIDLSQAIDNQ